MDFFDLFCFLFLRKTAALSPALRKRCRCSPCNLVRRPPCLSPLACPLLVIRCPVFGTTHHTRLEDGPIMPVERVGFELKPDGFFDSSPSMDLPCDACAAKLPKSKL